MSAPDSTAPGANGPPTFVTTYWSMVLAVGGESPAASALLDELCRTYWYPLYACVRRKGHDVHDVQDLTQEFFARLLRGNSLREVAPEKGKFRSFLLAALNHFLAKEWRRETAQKRGGGQVVFSFVAADAEGRYQLEPVDAQTPEKVFERRWAMTLFRCPSRVTIHPRPVGNRMTETNPETAQMAPWCGKDRRRRRSSAALPDYRGTLPSLPGLFACGGPNPALKRWAVLGRPSGTGLTR